MLALLLAEEHPCVDGTNDWSSLEARLIARDGIIPVGEGHSLGGRVSEIVKSLEKFVSIG